MNALSVNREHPCSICGEEGWCSYIPDTPFVMCVRVQSIYPLEYGYLHELDTEYDLDAVSLNKEWSVISEFAESLGIDGGGLKYLGVGYSEQYKSWAFPMKDASEKLTGYRLGTKKGFVIPGSTPGMFIPEGLKDSTLMICSSVLDTVVALSFGYYAIGYTEATQLQGFIRLKKISRVIIVSENVYTSIQENERLKFSIPSTMWIPPTKNLFEFAKRGGTREVMDSSLKDLIWHLPQK